MQPEYRVAGSPNYRFPRSHSRATSPPLVSDEGFKGRAAGTSQPGRCLPDPLVFGLYKGSLQVHVGQQQAAAVPLRPTHLHRQRAQGFRAMSREWSCLFFLLVLPLLKIQI